MDDDISEDESDEENETLDQSIMKEDEDEPSDIEEIQDEVTGETHRVKAPMKSEEEKAQKKLEIVASKIWRYWLKQRRAEHRDWLGRIVGILFLSLILGILLPLCLSFYLNYWKLMIDHVV